MKVITITEKAADKAKEILAAEGKEGWGLRVFTVDGGCCGPSYGLDIEENSQADDEIVEKNGLKVFLDSNTVIALSGMRLDYHEDGEREGFMIIGESAPSCSSGCSSCG